MFGSADYMRGRASVENERAMDDIFATAFRVRRPAVVDDRPALVAHIAQLEAQLQQTGALLDRCVAERRELFENYRDEHLAHQATQEELATAKRLIVFLHRTSQPPS